MNFLYLSFLLGSVAVPATGANRTFAPSAAPPVSTFTDDTCFVRANDDDVPDLVVWTGGWNDARLLAVDGKSGRGLWVTDPIPHMAETFLFCADLATVVVGVSDFTVHAFEAASGRERWKVTVSDQPHKAAVGSGCLLVLTQDEKRVGLSLATGEARSCSTKQPPRNFRDREPETVQRAGFQITLDVRTKGTPMLSLVAARGKKTVWERPLGMAKMLGAPPLTADEAGLYVAGVDMSDKSPVLQSIESASGQVRWKRTLDEGIHIVLASGGRLYVGTTDHLQMLDPSTGDAVWNASLPPLTSSRR
jgi:outer membrane protein assembly factor BamB